MLLHLAGLVGAGGLGAREQFEPAVRALASAVRNDPNCDDLAEPGAPIYFLGRGRSFGSASKAHSSFAKSPVVRQSR
jgi:hypothetical protein